ncbi:hypothetical protein K3495_g13843 [Podosphaera aphanis]|nr:hypothetical protein K3495_g13843 [Podosphaera aphanis]
MPLLSKKARIAAAVKDFQGGKFPSKHRAAQAHDIDHKTLAANLVAPTGISGGHNKDLNDAQEEALREYCDRCIRMNISPKLKDVRRAANSLLRLNGSGKRVSHMFATRWMKRNSQYKIRRSKKLSAARKAATERGEVEEHFNRFRNERSAKKIKPENIWNFDETGFGIGCLNGQFVLIWAEQKAVYLIDPENWDYVTCIEAISANSKTTPPMVILSGALLLEKFFGNELDDGVLFAITESGYTNDMLSFEWMKHFDKHAKPSNPEEWRMLVMDDHGSHVTLEFVDYCHNNKILPFLPPQHLTHLLQPFDIGVFQQYKHYHQECLYDYNRWSGFDFDKFDFPKVLQRMRNLAFKRRTIGYSWKESGLHPFNLERVKHKMLEIATPERAQTPPPSHGIDWTTVVTLKCNLADIRRFTDYINGRIIDDTFNDIPLTPSVCRAFLKRENAIQPMLLSGGLAEQELIERSEKEREKKGPKMPIEWFKNMGY